MQYWLFKSEPSTWSWDDQVAKGDAGEEWDGVRNYQARNFLKSMTVGDIAFFYHSNTKPPGIAGLMKISEEMVVDPTQFDQSNKYYDPKSTPDAPRWHTVTVTYIKTFAHHISLDELKKNFSPDDLQVVKRGNRLSVMPITEDVAKQILILAKS